MPDDVGGVSPYDRFLADRVLGRELARRILALDRPDQGPVLMVLSTQQDPATDRRWSILLLALRETLGPEGPSVRVFDVSDRPGYDHQHHSVEPLRVPMLRQALDSVPGAAVVVSLMGLPEGSGSAALLRDRPLLVYEGRTIDDLRGHPSLALPDLLVTARGGLDFQTVQRNLEHEDEAFARYYETFPRAESHP